MTTTGEYLVQNSSLSSGTALQLLLTLQTGTGSGEPVLTTRIYTCLEVPRVTYTARKPKSLVQPINEKDKKQRRKKEDKYAYVYTETNSGYVLTGEDVIAVIRVAK